MPTRRTNLVAQMKLFTQSKYLGSEVMRSRYKLFLVCSLYIIGVEAIAHAVVRESGPPDKPGFLHGFLRDLSGAPPLARWDSIWYYGIANEGYSGNPHSPGFLPLYPFLMRLASYDLALDLFTAGLWISRIATLVALLLLAEYSRTQGPEGTPSLPPVLALLAFPSAFILVSVYSESLFLATSLAAFVFARGERPWAAAAAALAAGLTRIHGLALLPALALLGFSQWRTGRRPLAAFAPALGVGAAYLGLTAYFALTFGDPLVYFVAKRDGFNTPFRLPWEALPRSMDRFNVAVARDGLEALYVGLEFPCLWLLVFCIFYQCGNRRWPEALFVAGGTIMSLFTGSLWGLPRFVLSFFPVFPILALLHERKVIWWLYLLCGVLLQIANLVQYVKFGLPAP
jgi:hypothetical protein